MDRRQGPDRDHWDDSGSSPPRPMPVYNLSELLDSNTAASYLGICRTKLYQLSTGSFPEIGSITIGRSRRWARRDLDRYIERLRKLQVPQYLRAG